MLTHVFHFSTCCLSHTKPSCPSGAAGAGAAAAAAEAQGRVQRRGRISTSSLDTSESAEDSEDTDAILPLPMHMSIGSPTAAAEADVPACSRIAAAGRRPELDGRSEVSEDAAAAAARGTSYYRRLRRERRQPAAGEMLLAFDCRWCNLQALPVIAA
jgi:hypothetical protein